MVRGATLASLHHFHMLDMDPVATPTVPISEGDTKFLYTMRLMSPEDIGCIVKYDTIH
jgi:hypothetical protein